MKKQKCPFCDGELKSENVKRYIFDQFTVTFNKRFVCKKCKASCIWTKPKIKSKGFGLAIKIGGNKNV